MSDLDRRVIAIAGAAGGLGPTVAATLAKRGATLALTDVDQEALDALAGTLRDEHGLDPERLDARAVDLLDEGATREWAAQLAERFGQVDGLVHLVGGWRGGEPLATASLDDYAWLHDLLVHTVQHATRAFHDALAAGPNGRFVLVSSAQAQSPDGTNAAYAATKAAAETWTLALADSFAKAAADGPGRATANVVVVNAILTPAMRERNPDKPYPTFTPVEDIAEAIAFICSDAGARMNGKRLELHP